MADDIESSKAKTARLAEDWAEVLCGSKAMHGKNPMPKTFDSISVMAGSNGCFKNHNLGNLGIRWWEKA